MITDEEYAALEPQYMGMIIKFASYFEHTGLEFQEKINLGRATLVRAQQTFDPTKGVSFVTYLGTCLLNAYRQEANRFKTQYRRYGFIQSLDFEYESMKDDRASTLRELLVVPAETPSLLELEQTLRTHLRTKHDTGEIKPCVYRDLLFILDHSDWSQQEIAKQLNTSQAQISRRKVELKKWIKQYFHEVGVW